MNRIIPPILFLLAVLCVVVPCLLVSGCSAAAATVKPAAYEAELIACSEKSSTLFESIACENRARAREGRPLRPYPAFDRDGGVQ